MYSDGQSDPPLWILLDHGRVFCFPGLRVMAGTYAKPFLTFDDQLTLLQQRGLAVADRDAALHMLRAVGYYTLGGYLYPMREFAGEASEQPRLDQFVSGASFEQMVDLYRFDRHLRLLCLEALETIERCVKVAVAYTLGQLDPFAHHSGRWHDQRNLQAPAGRNSPHRDWCNNHDDKIRRRADVAIAAFVQKYGTPLPIWIAIDVMDFGDVSKLLAQLGKKTQVAVAQEFGLRRGVDVVSWVRTICLVRNISAHHDRLWNRELTDKPTKPKGPETAWFAGVLEDEHYLSRTYMALLIIAYFARQIDPGTTWPERVALHLITLPEGNGVSFRALGAPEKWTENPTWK